jgi:hypothetical protein
MGKAKRAHHLPIGGMVGTARWTRLCPSYGFSVRLRVTNQNKMAGRKLPMNRRELLRAAAVLPLAQTAFVRDVSAQNAYPSRNITMIVPFPAGGQADLAARPVAAALWQARHHR